MTPQGLRDAVKAATRTNTGAELSPHQFRHLAAKLYLEAYPEAIEQVQLPLNHASSVTTARHYASVRTAEAARRYDEEVIDPVLQRTAFGSKRRKK